LRREVASEDFGEFGLADHRIPVFLFRVGATDPATLAPARVSGAAVPSNHSPLFAPVPQTTISTGVKAMTAAVMDLMKR
jgi:hippurate hydrolase